MAEPPLRAPGSPQQRSAWPIPERGGSGHGLGNLLPPALAIDDGGASPLTRSDYRILLVDDDPATLMAMKRHLLRMRGPVQYQGALVAAR
jgi:hypothetical protein